MDNEQILTRFKEAIASVKIKKKIRQLDIASSLGYGGNHLSSVLNGTYSINMATVPLVMEKVYGISAEWLRTGKGSMYLSEDKKKGSALKANELGENKLNVVKSDITPVQSDDNIIASLLPIEKTPGDHTSMIDSIIEMARQSGLRNATLTAALNKNTMALKEQVNNESKLLAIMDRLFDQLNGFTDRNRN